MSEAAARAHENAEIWLAFRWATIAKRSNLPVLVARAQRLETFMMDVVARGPVRVGLLTWRSSEGLVGLTIVCKLTFHLTPFKSQVADDPDPVNEEDNHWDDDSTKSLYSPIDLVPFKARADVLVVGSAYAPEKRAVRSFTAQVNTAGVDKAIEVWCDRVFTLDGALREGRPIARARLRYERAGGGPDTTNPVGMASDGPRDALGQRQIPSLQPVGVTVARPGDVVLPIGFGPIAPSWPDRASKLGRIAGRFPNPGWAERPLPEGIDPAFFNTAPHDQQVREIRDDERIVLVNLHPDHARLVTALPGLRPSITLERPGAGSEPIGARIDTLWIDTDRGVCTVAFRGHVWLRSAAERGRILVTLLESRERDSPRPGGEVNTSSTETILPFAGGNSLPFAAGAGPSPLAQARRSPSHEEIASAEEISVDLAEERGSEGSETLFLPGLPSAQTLPFESRPSADATLMVSPEAAALIAPVVSTPRGPLPEGHVPLLASIPSSPPPIAPQIPPIAASPGPPVRTPVAPPPLVEPRRAPSVGIGPSIADSPWGGVNREVAKPMTVGEAAAARSAERERVGAPSPPVASPKGQAAPPAVVVSPAIERLHGGGAADVSNAAAASAQSTAAKPTFSFRPALELVWHNPGSMTRIRKHEVWKALLADLKPRPEEDDLDDDVPAPRRVPPRDRRELLAILSRGEPTDADGVELSLVRALEDESGFLPPLVLAAGDLELQFDELEALKATIAAVSPHLGANESLKKTVDGIQELFKTPFVQGASSVLTDLSRRLREAFAPVQKTLPTYDMEAHVQATLVDHRHYQKRTAFGQPRIRALFTSPGARGVVPAYLPDGIAKELPGFRRMRIRMIAEVRPRAEEGEAGLAALRVLALGREAVP